MKYDSEYTKKLLLLIENEPDYIISSHKLISKLRIKTKEQERKFMGHILLLADNKLLESLPSKYPFGFVYCVGGEYSILDVGYRLTARGYEMVDIYKNSFLYNKVKDLSIDNALEVAKYILRKYAVESKKRKPALPSNK